MLQYQGELPQGTSGYPFGPRKEQKRELLHIAVTWWMSFYIRINIIYFTRYCAILRPGKFWH